MIDSHCHLADEASPPTSSGRRSRARTPASQRVLVILEGGQRRTKPRRREKLDRLWPDVRVAIGVHPHQAHQFADDPSAPRPSFASSSTRRRRRERSAKSAWTTTTTSRPVTYSRRSSARKCAWPATLNRPVVIHTREADDDTLAILRDEGGGELRGVLHCFTGNAALRRAGLDLGFYVSLAGIVTFPEGRGPARTVRRVPLDRLLTETDSPFLAPVPYRGKRNEPAYVARVVEALAELHGTRRGHGGTTAANFATLFQP